MAVAVTDARERYWTYDDLKELPDDGRRWEIIGGALVEMTGPTLLHAQVLSNLTELLLPSVRSASARWYGAPVDVFLTGDSVVQPDFSVVLPDGRARRTIRGLEGPPDLVVEVVSPSNRNHDRLTKRALDGLAGVRESWLVDPATRTVEILVLDRDALHGHAVRTGGDMVGSPLLPEAAFAADDVFAWLDEIEEPAAPAGA